MTIRELKAAGKTPKIFTSEQLHEAQGRVLDELALTHPDVHFQLAAMLAVAKVMIELGLHKPEDFYED